MRVLRGGADVSANYSLAWYPGTLRVTPRQVTLTSASATKPFDGTPLVAREVAVGGDGFVGADGATFAVSGTQTSKGSSANAFTWAFKAGTNPAFYDVSTAEGTLEVTALDIGGGDDGDWEIALGPALEYNGIEQIQTLATVRFRGLDVDYSVENDRGTDAGGYSLTLVGQGDFAGTHDVPWAIAPKPLALAAGSAEKVYDGTPLVCADVAATGFVAGEGAAFRCDGARTDAGESANEVAEILWADGTKGSNYAVSKTAGTLRVTPRAATLTAPTKSKPYDGAPLTFGADEIETAGIVAGESFAFSEFSSRTEAGQSPATFAYAAGPGTSLANYAVTVVPGTLTVAKSATEIVVQAASATWTYDGEAHEKREWSATNLETLVPGDELDVAFDPASRIAEPGEAANAIAAVRVLRGGADVSANYSLAWYPGTLRVTPRPVEVRVTGATASHVYDGAEKTVSGYEIATDDALYDITADTAFSGAASVSATDAGSYPMGLSPADFENANRCFDVTYRVADGRLDIARADISGDGGDFVAELGDDPLYNGTVQAVEIRSATWRGLPATYALAGEYATHAGEYALTFKGTGNFSGEWTTTWRIRRRAVTMTSASAEKTYDGTPLAGGTVAVTGDGFIGLEGATFDVTGAQTAAGSSENVFTYALKAGTLAGDYDIATVFGTLTVRKATHDTSGLGWNVAADAAAFLYDGAEHGVALTGLPEGVTATYEGNRATDAGSYTATAHLVYDTANYEAIPDPEPLAWRIDKRPITLFAASKDKPYDGWPLEVKPEDITAAGSGYAPGECFAYGDFASITDVGEIPATFSYADSATAKVSNYDVTVQGGQTLKVTVGGDQISVTADSATWVYDGETHRLPSWTVFNGDKLLAGHAFDIAISADSAVTTPAEGIVSNRFDHVRIVDAEGADRTRNYNLFVYEGELRVTNASIAPLIGDALHRTVEATYDGLQHSAAVEPPALQRPATVRYRVGEGNWTDEAPAWKHAGEYAAEFEVSAEFYDAVTGRVDVAISPRPVTLASPTKSKPYDGAPLTFGAAEISVGGDGIVAGERFVYSDFASITDAVRIDAEFAWAAGSGTLASDYAVTVEKGTLTVNRSATEIVVTAKDGQWVFDGAAHTLHEWTAENLDALVAGDELEVAFDPASAITEPGEAANAITGVRVLRGDEDVSANYALSWWPGTLRVAKAQIGPRMEGVETSATAIYDGEGHAATVAAPALLTAPVAVRYAATADGPWGAAPVAFTDAGAWTAFFRVEAPCYEPYVGTTTMTIAPREVTLVSAAATKVYDGTPLRKDEVAVKEGSLPFAAGEGFSAHCTGVVTDVGGVENAFDYALAAGTKAGNYTIRKEYGWLRVTPATMDISALSAAASWQGPYDGTPHGAALAPPYPRAEVSYAAVSGDESAYGPESPTWTDVSTNAVFFKVVAPNYEPGYGCATVAIGPRDIALAQIGPLANEFYTGYPIEPVPTVADTVPITQEDWTVRWEDNIEAGTARAVVEGRRNYGGEAVRTFEIAYKPEIVIVIDLSNIAVGQGWWGSATLLTNGIPVPGILPGARTEVTVPTETDIDLSFSPDPGFRLGSVIVDRRLWTTNAVWSFPSAKADKSFEASFLPAPEPVLAWTRGGDGRQYATISFVNHAGYAEAMRDLSFLFADKEWVNNGAVTTNLLVDAASRPRQPVEVHDGATFRRVDFDAARLAAAKDGATVAFGGVDLRSDDGIVRMYSAKRNLDALVGCLAWETNGKRYYQPLVGSGAIHGLVAEDIVTAAKFNQALALGFDPAFLAAAEVRCRFTDIRVDADSDTVSGAFEIVAATADGIEAESSGLDPAHTSLRLLGSDTPGGEWSEIPGAAFDVGDGPIGFGETESPRSGAPARFYRVTIEVDEVFE
ncbi:MAG: hypothetical protein IJ783_00055 [Kiritimatiellae bacterium]|nr:hypothetical protein [Kiritimatiellia bacterium]